VLKEAAPTREDDLIAEPPGLTDIVRGHGDLDAAEVDSLDSLDDVLNGASRGRGWPSARRERAPPASSSTSRTRTCRKVGGMPFHRKA
jgi:hypothetical protein